MMKTILLLILFIGCSCNVQAQLGASSFSGTDDLLVNSLVLKHKRASSWVENKSVNCERFMELKKRGKLLLYVGVPLAVTGLAVMITGVVLDEQKSTPGTMALQYCGGAVYVGGVIVTGIGTATYLYGNIRHKRNCEKIGLQFQVSSNGVGLALSF